MLSESGCGKTEREQALHKMLGFNWATGQVIGPLFASLLSPLRSRESSQDFCKEEMR